MSAPAAPEVPPQAREVVDAVAAAPTAGTKIVVVGGLGTGKSATMAAIRTALRAAGVEVVTRPGSAPGKDTAAVVDDAHLLPETDLSTLADWVNDRSATVVIATQPYQHRGALRAITSAIERENPPVLLGPLAPQEVHRMVAAAIGCPASAEALPAVMAATAGLPFLVRAALDQVSEPATIGQAARFALIDRLRAVDETVLDALLIASLSPDLGAADVAAALGVPIDHAQLLVDRARGSGLVEPSHSPAFLRSVHRAVAQIVGAARHHDIEKSLLSTQLEKSTLSAELALRLAEHGVGDDQLAAVLEAHAERAVQPQAAARLYRAALDAGATRLTARLADALALTGDCATAGRLADDLLASGDPDERAAAVRIAASVAAHDGSSGQAADLFRWLGPHPDAFVGAAGAVVLLGAGDAAAARASLDTQAAGPPTTATRTARSLAEGLLQTLDHPFAVSMGRLGQSLAGERIARGATPDSPAALVTLVALHGGDPVRARSVIGRAVRAGADDLFAYRHRLLLGWVDMLDGRAVTTAVPDDASLHRRDALWAAALRVGLARRTGDSGALQQHWYTALEVLAEYAVDLYSLPPLGELWVAAARLRQVERIQPALDDAFELLSRLGDPVLWSVPLRWYGVHAGILASSPGAVAPHGQALTTAASSSPFAKALAGAGRVWLRVLANHVDPGEVAPAASGLAEYGLTWDATRLASQAALQSADARVAGAMLQLARDLKVTTAADEQAAEPPRAPQPAPRESARLSEREREVAELLLLGMPYRDIGNQLFISAKTVEHHVARIRRRLGAESRSELLSMLRAMLAPQA
ncbi:MAG: isoniazid response ATPase/transcriptional regulator IniR [Candidatus Sericytochromatia bacterium]